MNFSEFLATAVDYAWGMPLLILLIGGGLWLVFVSRLKSLLGFFHGIKLLFGKFHHDGDDKDEGQINHFMALSNALSATVGMGNIAGVAVAITAGGPGAIFWMWVSALIGMNTKFVECTLAVMFRGKDYQNEVQGGPMYVIDNALPKVFKPLAVFFAVCGLIGTQSLFQSNQFASLIVPTYGISKLTVSIILAALTGYILLGGLKRLSNITSTIVPFMCGFYVLSCLIIIVMNIQMVPGILFGIFEHAFTGSSAIGGVAGMAVKEIMKQGVKRAAFSNEAGVGTAPMAHGNAKTTEPIAEGLVAMVGPFIDTLIVCTMTALVILISVDLSDPNNPKKILLTAMVFKKQFGSIGVHLLSIAAFFFGFSTILGMANYNKKCFDYLFKGRFIFNDYFFIILYCGSLIWGSMNEPDDVVNLLDLAYGLMAFPNMITSLILAPKVKVALDLYYDKYIKS
jgi:alanine or glycine:cation symporter, AGCS family